MDLMFGARFAEQQAMGLEYEIHPVAAWLPERAADRAGEGANAR